MTRQNSTALGSLSFVAITFVIAAMALVLFGSGSPLGRPAFGPGIPDAWFLALLLVPVLSLVGTLAAFYLWHGPSHGR